MSKPDAAANTQVASAATKRLPPAAGMGRKKGVPNKVTAAAKDAIAMAAERLGGTDRLVAWAQEDPQNERLFWGTIYPKLLPLQVSGVDGGPIAHRVEIAIVDPEG